MTYVKVLDRFIVSAKGGPQRRTPKAWILHCEGGVDDRSKQLQHSLGKSAARIMHELIEQILSYIELIDARVTRICSLEAQSAKQASTAISGPSGTQGGDDGTLSPSGT